MSHFRYHVFVCQNRRDQGGRPACGTQGGDDLFEALTEGLAARPNLWGQVKISSTDCLGPCFDGPNAVVYPEGIWYAGLTPADVPKLFESHFEGGTPLTECIYQFPD